MTPAELDRLCAEALARIAIFINRAHGQQLRRLKATWSQRA